MLYRDQTNQMQFNVLDSHDTARLLTETKEEKDLMKQVMAFTYIQPGVPCLYYGDEIGMTGANDPDCRKCMVWDTKKQDHDLLDFTKKLIATRKNNAKILSEGAVHWEQVQADSGTIIFERHLDNQIIRGVFNTGEVPIVTSLPGEVLLENLSTQTKEQQTIAPKGFVLTRIEK